jgi:hypothetical protein
MVLIPPPKSLVTPPTALVSPPMIPPGLDVGVLVGEVELVVFEEEV